MVARNFVHRALASITRGTVVIVDAEGASTFGGDTPEARLTVHHPSFYAKLLRGGSLAAGTSYLDGDWDCDDLVELVRIMARNQDALDGLGSMAAIPMRLYHALAHALRRNSRAGSRRNIEAHYDLGDDLFRLFLDKRMMYSSAVFETGAETLDEASDAKLMRLCRKLDLKRSDHLLEIGTGWGGLAVFAAERFGCRVTTTTISKAQHAHAQARVDAAGLGDRVEVLCADYRSLTGQFDKLVSVEMVEAVGHQYLDAYFQTCARLLRPNGLMAMQAITIRDAAYRRALKTVDFIKRYIFPGGFMPCNSVLTAAAGAAHLTLVNLEDLGADYARTLRAWRERLEQNRSQAIALGYDERFLRMWRYYFAYCEGGFMERSISDVQMLLTMPEYTGPIWRAHAPSP
ncbi:MAG: cyclopropane-fatty-acyl-phospholipid synthase [Gammaproteobacteria bacterium]|nr:cyclopropane-fatty-acyl-phospholipid synthase [Gammaproteobacteria bacterium]